jgi:hypothetical protein
MHNDTFSKLTPEQRRQLAEEMGLAAMVAKWRCEDLLKEAKRRYEATSSNLKSEQAKFDQIKAAEQERVEALLAIHRRGLDGAEAEHFEALAALKLAEQDLQALG